MSTRTNCCAPKAALRKRGEPWVWRVCNSRARYKCEREGIHKPRFRAAYAEFVAALAGHPPRPILIDADAIDVEDRADHLNKVLNALSAYLTAMLEDIAQNVPGGLDLRQVDALLSNLASKMKLHPPWRPRRSRQADRQTGSPAWCASIRCSRHPIPGARRRRQRHLRAGRPDRVAYASARSDADRYFRRGARAALGRPDRGNPAGRCRLVPARRKALAWRVGDNGDDAYRHSRNAQRQSRRLDGKGQ